jgi:hypothetical protein
LRLKTNSKAEHTEPTLSSGEGSTLNAVEINRSGSSVPLSPCFDPVNRESKNISKEGRFSSKVSLPQIPEIPEFDSLYSPPAARLDSGNHAPTLHRERIAIVVLLLFYVNSVLIGLQSLMRHLRGVPTRNAISLSATDPSDSVCADNLQTSHRVDAVAKDPSVSRSNEAGNSEQSSTSDSAPSPIVSRSGSFDNPLPAYSSRVILDLQRSDPDIAAVKKWLTENQKPGKDFCRSDYSDELNHYYHLFEHLCLSKDGAVCYKYFFKQSGKFRELLCVPFKARENIMKSLGCALFYKFLKIACLFV